MKRVRSKSLIQIPTSSPAPSPVPTESVKSEAIPASDEQELTDAEISKMYICCYPLTNRLNDPSIDPVRAKFRNFFYKDFQKQTAEMSVSVKIDSFFSRSEQFHRQASV